jgi:hypothetical protein
VADDGTPVQGRAIILWSWLGDALFAITAIPAALAGGVLRGTAIGVALALFAVALVIWAWAFVIALGRTTRGDDVVVASLFLLQGPVPRRVRVQLFGSLVVCLTVAVATAAAEPFGVLVPMLPLGFAGLWGARHGTYPPRRRREEGRSADRRVP